MQSDKELANINKELEQMLTPVQLKNKDLQFLFVTTRELSNQELETLFRFGTTVVYNKDLPSSVKDIDFRFLVVDINKGRKWIEKNMNDFFDNEKCIRIAITKHKNDKWLNDCKIRRVIKKIENSFKYENFIDSLLACKIHAPDKNYMRILRFFLKLCV